jgi:hypothetical protein
MTRQGGVLTVVTASIPEEILQDLHIHSVAYYIHRGKEVLCDLVTIQRAKFLEWLEAANILPTTASPGTGDSRAVLFSGQSLEKVFLDGCSLAATFQKSITFWVPYPKSGNESGAPS